MSFRPFTLVALLSLAACGGTESAQSAVAEPPAPEQNTPPPLSADDLAKGSENIALVPSVVETQSALAASGIETKLVDVMSEHKFDVKSENMDNVAVSTGALIADMLLTVKTVEKDKLLAELESIKTGIDRLQGGTDIQNVINDIQERVKADAVTRDELLKELDELSGAVIPELEFNGQERVVPLIQAGSWLEGANLVAKAVKKSGKPDAADALLKQPAVVDYFIKYVKTEGAEKAPAAVTAKLEEALTTLKGLSEKSEPFSNEDIDAVIKTTDEVLALL